MTSQIPLGYRSIRLQTAQFEPMRDFYASILGLPTRMENGRLVIQAGSTRLEFTKAPTGDPYYHFAFNIPENQIDSALDWLKKRTPIVKSPSNGEDVIFFESWNAHAVYFFDPAGNILEFIARHTLKNATGEPFTEKAILYASELGWVVSDVPATVQNVENSLGLKPYRPPAPDFAAVGDEHALLILAKTGRTWFGTESLPAQPFPGEAEILGPQTGQLEADGVKIHRVLPG